MNRRDFIKLGSLAGIAGLSARTNTVPKMTPRPNILFIMTDQQFAGSMSCAGNPHLKTPAMDSIAGRGIRFEKAYCNNPICVPSRASMITGRYPSEVGVNHNLHHKDLDTPSLGKLVKQCGYQTGYTGKWHIPMPAEDTEWHGFDFIRNARANGIDHLVAEDAADFLGERDKEKPWFLVTSFVNPHDICEWARLASGIDTPMPNGPIAQTPPPESCPPLPENFAIPKGEPSVIRELQANPDASGTYPVRDWPDERWRQYQWAYNRLIEKVDAEIGKILTTLEASGDLENTVILFTSDHGDGIGAHQWNQKTLFYDETARVPFIIAGSGIQNANTVNDSALIGTGIDIAATILDYAGAPLDPSYHGQSLKPVAEGAETETHDYVLSQTDLAPKYGQSGGVYGRMLRTQRYKYIVFSEGEHREQLFDLKNDPGELKDLTVGNKAPTVLAEHRSKLREALKQIGDSFIEYAI